MMNRLALAALVSLISFSAPVMAQTQAPENGNQDQQMQQQDGSSAQQEKLPQTGQ